MFVGGFVRRQGLIVSAALVLMLGCASDSVPVVTQTASGTETLGAAKGTACGSLLLADSAFSFIPVMLNSRVERAHARAVASVPEATGLVNVRVSESWFWWLIGRTHCTTLEGDAVR